MDGWKPDTRDHLNQLYEMDWTTKTFHYPKLPRYLVVKRHNSSDLQLFHFILTFIQWWSNVCPIHLHWAPQSKGNFFFHPNFQNQSTFVQLHIHVSNRSFVYNKQKDSSIWMLIKITDKLETDIFFRSPMSHRIPVGFLRVFVAWLGQDNGIGKTSTGEGRTGNITIGQFLNINKHYFEYTSWAGSRSSEIGMGQGFLFIYFYSVRWPRLNRSENLLPHCPWPRISCM